MKHTRMTKSKAKRTRVTERAAVIDVAALLLGANKRPAVFTAPLISPSVLAWVARGPGWDGVDRVPLVPSPPRH
jgi:hypothetical protein